MAAGFVRDACLHPESPGGIEAIHAGGSTSAGFRGRAVRSGPQYRWREWCRLERYMESDTFCPARWLGRYSRIDWSKAVVDSCSVRAVFGGRRQDQILAAGPCFS